MAMLRRRAAIVLASSAVMLVLAGAGIVFAGSLGPAPATTSFKRIAYVAPAAPGRRVIPGGRAPIAQDRRGEAHQRAATAGTT
jgi:hypothetical protein